MHTYIYIFIWQRLINPVIVDSMKTGNVPPRVTKGEPRLTYEQHDYMRSI